MALVIVMTTTDKLETAEKFAAELVERKLAACVQIEKIKSLYRWQEMIQEDEEFRLMIKTVAEKVASVKEYLLNFHNYEVPEIIVVPVSDSSQAYREWVEEETK